MLKIEGEAIDGSVTEGGYLPMLRVGNREYFLAEDAETAGEAAREYWADMAANDPEEFACIIGNETLIQWGMGQYAGPGSTHVRSLSEWLDLHLTVPEEQWAGYDGNELTVTDVSEELEEELGFVPTVAYRHN